MHPGPPIWTFPKGQHQQNTWDAPAIPVVLPSRLLSLRDSWLQQKILPSPFNVLPSSHSLRKPGSFFFRLCWKEQHF